jgi:acyl carrier protein
MIKENGMVDMKLETVIRNTFKLNAEQALDNIGPGSIPQWDSLGHVALIHAVEEAYSIHFTVDEIAQIESLGTLKEVLKRHVSG